MDTLPTEALERVLAYMWQDEERHYLESEHSQRSNHIFNDLRALKQWSEKCS